MFFVTIRMKVGPDKRMELSQAITSLMGSIRVEKGCRGCNFYQSVEDENEFRVFGEWASREELASHLRSEHFKVLLGTTHLLDKPHEMGLYEVVAGSGKGGEADTLQDCTVKQATG